MRQLKSLQKRKGVNKMKFFNMLTTFKAEPCLLDVQDPQNILFKFFILNLNDELNKVKMPIRLYAQEFYNFKNIRDFDYFQATENFPVFSKKAKDILEKYLIDQMDFYPCTIIVDQHKIEAFIGKIKIYKKLFNRVNDFKIEFIGNNIDNDFIIRDSEMEHLYVVTENFKKKCEDNNLAILFKEFLLMG
ncbi:hypothetical protein RFI36_15580 [Acinetobacter gerneri]|uniref:DUF2726 domain-containing protein n=1 Tax=Acinetobacter gerneri TaxID=202952 RepID=A0AAW8JJA6_9GAMM|nr:hypothetical protein [Acinetobacter gerneri]MDQ9011139.1 hypothetical protein [Acinetobacter gerneri]MDQ9015275.1 hypothetical protein [Acinetobacter gerneri]MDQ9026446.1 hypothetical protein [Acinetobacter gerneri]MDQ9053727.1 hypothetical protein [Acinetobacter gerneri]MDQ9061332.1 hypothetical protein [Acinetobacter gerneri]